MKRQFSINFDRHEIAFILAFILLAEPLTNEGGEKTRVPRENPRATHQALICSVPLGMKRQFSINFDRHEIAFILAFILLAEPLTNEGGEKTGVPRENP